MTDKSIRYIIVSIFFLQFFSCSPYSKEDNQQVLRIFAVNYPLAYFAERIGGKHVKVINLIPKGVDPAGWSPGKGDLDKIASCDLILLNGNGFASWVEHAELPSSKTVNTTQMVKDHYLSYRENKAMVPCTWIDFDMAKIQAGAVKKALVKRLPQYARDFENGFLKLYHDLNKLNKKMVLVSDKLPCDVLYLYAARPVYDYWANAYQLRLVNLDWTPGIDTKESQWHELNKLLETKPSNAILWEIHPPEEIRRKLQNDFDLQSVVFNPCVQKPDSGDFITVMNQNLDNLYEYSKY